MLIILLSIYIFFFFKAAVVEKPLTQEIISTTGCLSLLCKTGNSLAHAYVRLDIKDRYDFIFARLLSIFFAIKLTNGLYKG